MQGVLRDAPTSKLDDKHKALFAFIAKVNHDSIRIGPDDTARLRESVTETPADSLCRMIAYFSREPR